MMFDFDYGLAKKAIEIGTGCVKTKSGFLVDIKHWNFTRTFPIAGYIKILPGGNLEGWTEKGIHVDYLDDTFDGMNLVLEIYDDY